MSLHCSGSVAQGTMSPAPACTEQPPTAVPKAWPWQSSPWAPSMQEPVWGDCDPAYRWGRGQTTTVPQEWEQGEPLNLRWGVGRGQWCGAGGDGLEQAGAAPWLDTMDGHGVQGQWEGHTAMGGADDGWVPHGKRGVPPAKNTGRNECPHPESAPWRRDGNPQSWGRGTQSLTPVPPSAVWPH